ncbi:MAG: hypothetical protein KAH20_09435 [Methylococcales bacterium]|nr:hypothetical protein [Methylococcales bacterium]
MKQSLKHSVQQHLNKKSLSSQQLKQLLLRQEKKYRLRKSYLPWFKIVSVAPFLMVSVVLSVYFSNSVFFSTQTLGQRIAEEVANNHLKLKPLEVNSNTLEGIIPYFDQLDFSPLSPSFFTLSKQNLLGARYCSIQGVTALQLRMMDYKTDKIQTLYETEYDKKVFMGFPKTAEEGKPLTIYVKGMKVDMWVEKGILFALIESL